MGTKIFLTFLIFCLQFFTPRPAHAAWTGDCVAETNVATIRGITCLIEKVILPFPALIVLVALGMILFASVRVILSGSDPKAYASAMQTLLFAVIGIILLSAAWLILVTIEKFTGAKVTKFGIPDL